MITSGITSLRSKALLGLLLACLIAVIPATLFGWRVVSDIQDHFGRAYARNLAELSRQRILSPVVQDLILSQRLADTVLLEAWFQDIEDDTKRQRFFAEAQRYATVFSSGAYFAISSDTHEYFFNESARDFSDQPRYSLKPDQPESAWYYSLINDIEDYNINVNPDHHLKTTRVWLNVAVRDAKGTLLGLAGTGLDLTRFINEFIASSEVGVTPLIIDREGAIQAHPDPSRIAYGSGAGVNKEQSDFAKQALNPEQQQAWFALLQRSLDDPQQVQVARFIVEGRPHLVAVAYLRELDWYLITLVDLNVAQVISSGWWASLLLGLAVVLLILLLGMTLAVERLLVRPLKLLRNSTRQIAKGDYQIALETRRQDEIGELSRAFSTMVGQIQNHTQDLEAKVKARTHALEASHQELASVNKLVTDSIDYASLIQRAILPDLTLERELPHQQSVLWRPKDVVGGDFYLFQRDEDGYLAGIVDCAGHGVPGALMTMLARAALDNAIRQVGIHSPALVLKESDQLLRAMLHDLELPRALATNMDAALVWLDAHVGRFRFAGAKLSLYHCQGTSTLEIKGHRRALVGRKIGDYQDTEGTLSPQDSLYMTSDGFLDQAGGELGFGMGSTGFMALLQDISGQPIEEQAAALAEAFDRYRGSYDQRDDVCVLAIRRA